MSSIKGFLNQKVKVITADGKLFLGTLEGFDNTTNLLLADAKERLFSIDQPKLDIDLGGLIIRGDNVVCLGVYDITEEEATDYSKILTEPLKGTKNPIS